MAALHLTNVVCLFVTCLCQVLWQLYTWRLLYVYCLCQVLWQLYTWRLLHAYLFVFGIMAALHVTTIVCILVFLRCDGSFTTVVCILVCLRCYGIFTRDDYWYVYLFVSCVMAALHLMTIACILVCLRCYGSFTPDDYCMYTCLSQVLWQLYTWWLLYVYLFVSGVMVALHLTTIVCILVCLRCYGSFTSDDYCVYTCLSQMLWQLSTWRLLYVSKS